MPPYDESTLGLGVNDPAYLDLVQKQQEALSRANQPYGMNAGQGAIAAGLGLLPALIGGLVKGKEGLNVGLQAGMGGVSMYDKTLENNFQRASENEKANAALYGAQANQVLQNELGFNRFMQQEKVRQDNRKEMKDLYPPAGMGDSGVDSDVVDASMAAALEKTTGIPADQLIGKSLDYVDRIQRNEQIAGNKKTQETVAAGEARRKKEQEMKTDEKYIEGFDWVEGKRPDAEKFKVARAVNEGGRLLLNDIRALRSSFAKYGENALTGQGAAEQQVVLKRALEHARIYNKAGASFTDLEAELSRVIENVQNVGMAKAFTNSYLFGKTPLKQLNIYEKQLKGEIKSRMRSNGYSYSPPKAAVISPAAFEQLKGASSGQ